MRKTLTIISLAALFLFSCGFLFSDSAQTREIRDIYFKKGERELLVFVEYTEGLTYESFTLFSPNRLVIDFANADRITSPGPFEVNAFGVKTIRTGKPNPYTCRIVFDLEERIPRYKISDTDSGLQISFWQEEIREAAPRVQPKVEPERPVVSERKVEEKPAVTPRVEKVQTTPPAAGKLKMGVGAFAGMEFMQDEVFQEAYGTMSIRYGADYFFQLPLQSPHVVDFWLGFSMMSDTGATTYTEDEIKFFTTHTSLAVRYIFLIKRINLFIGPGIDYIFYKETLPEDYPVSGISGSALGFHFQAGAYIDLLKNVSGKIFGKYNIARTTEIVSSTEEEISVNLGGIQLGIGLIYRFNI